MKAKETLNVVAYVYDCEHDGDIRAVKYECIEWFKENNIDWKVTSTYWDGQDCGEAYVIFSIPKTKDIENKVKESDLFNDWY